MGKPIEKTISANGNTDFDVLSAASGAGVGSYHTLFLNSASWAGSQKVAVHLLNKASGTYFPLKDSTGAAVEFTANGYVNIEARHKGLRLVTTNYGSPITAIVN